MKQKSSECDLDWHSSAQRLCIRWLMTSRHEQVNHMICQTVLPILYIRTYYTAYQMFFISVSIFTSQNSLWHKFFRIRYWIWKICNKQPLRPPVMWKCIWTSLMNSMSFLHQNLFHICWLKAPNDSGNTIPDLSSTRSREIWALTFPTYYYPLLRPELISNRGTG